MATMMQYLENSFITQPITKIEQNNSSSNIPYMLFVYRKQLKRLNKHAFTLSKSKLHLTQELVSYSVDRIREYDIDELLNINRQIDFTHKLKSRMKKMQKSCAIEDEEDIFED